MTPTIQANTPTQTPAPITLTVTPTTMTPDISGSSASNSGTAGDNSYQVTLHIALEPEDWIYHDYITLSCDSPNISLSPWQATQEPVARYINNFKETKRIYSGSFAITSIATKTNGSGQAMGANLGAGLASQTHATLGNLHLTYYKKSDKKITHHLIPLILSDQEISGEQVPESLNPSPTMSGATSVQIDDGPPFDTFAAANTQRKPQPSHKAMAGTAGEAYGEEGGDREEVKLRAKPEEAEKRRQVSGKPEDNTQVPEREQPGDATHETHGESKAHSAFSSTVQLAKSYGAYCTALYTTQYKAEIHTCVILLLILLFSLLKQKRRLACAAQNIALFILIWCYYAMADREIPSYCYWLLTAILALCVGILSIKKAEDMSPARFSKRIYRYLYYFLVIAGMITVASSLILCAKAAQAYYIISVAF
jgi:hypothetical protein